MEPPAQQQREIIEKLFRDAGYNVPELLAYVEKLEQDNAALTSAVRKLKLEAVRRSGAAEGMNSRLKDALRE